MTLLLGATTIGLILALLALGVYLSFRIFNFPDITADGSITFGASVTATLLVHHWSPWLATLAGFAAGTAPRGPPRGAPTKVKNKRPPRGILLVDSPFFFYLSLLGKSKTALLYEGN